MKEYWDAIELVGLPGMPGTVQGVRKKIRNENWSFRPRKGRGGGREYALSCLPEETRDHLVRQELDNLQAAVEPVKSLAVVDLEPAQPLEEMKQWQREIFDARCLIYREFENLKKTYGTQKAIAKILALVETETLPEHLMAAAKTANSRSGKDVRISRSLLLRWQKMVKDGGIRALAPKAAKRDSSMPEWVPYFVKCYAQPSKPSIKEAMENMKNIMPESITMPDYHPVKRFNAARSTLDRERGRHTGSAMKQFQGYNLRETEDLEPLEVCMCDGHSFKAKVAHYYHGRPFSPEVCAVLDARTRLVIGWSAGVAESSQTVADALRHAVTVSDAKPYGGVPAIFYTDNGSGNIGDLNTNRITGFYARLGITHETGLAGNPQGRGMVEILNKSLWIRAAKKLPTCTTRAMDKGVARKVFLMLDKAVRQGIQDDILPSWQDFMACCADQVDKYNRTPHSSLPKWIDPATGRKRHMAPLEYWVKLVLDGWEPVAVPEDLANDLFYPQHIRKTNRGSVSLYGNRYTNRSVLEHYHGQPVIVEYDIHDAKYVRVRDREQRLLCIASFDSSRDRMFPVEAGQLALETRAKGQIKRLERRIDDVNAQLGQSIDTILEPHKLTEAEERQAQRLLENTAPPVFEAPAFDESLLYELQPVAEKQVELDKFAHLWADDEPQAAEAVPGDEYAHLWAEDPEPNEKDDVPGDEYAHLWADESSEESKPEPAKEPALEPHMELELEPAAPKVVRTNFKKPSIVPGDRSWEDLDGFERYELLQKLEAMDDSMKKWCDYYETTDEYQLLKSLYREIAEKNG